MSVASSPLRPSLESRPPRTLLTPADVAKRVLDVIVASLLLVVLAPILFAIACAIGVSDRGPILFRQQRVGRAGNRFSMIKFRTMRVGADDHIHRRFVAAMLDGHGEPSAETGLYKLTDDPRVTRVGAFLRRWSLDELPQLWNVAVGSMSLVGPRPVLPWEAERFAPKHLRRFEVKPGITGLWQVSGRSALTMLQALELDLAYVERRSFWLDLTILVKTIPVVFWSPSAS
jgi:lipopolysaccharide/colanic/teichoic acid biosynthesis glycosyltransferase